MSSKDGKFVQVKKEGREEQEEKER